MKVTSAISGSAMMMGLLLVLVGCHSANREATGPLTSEAQPTREVPESEEAASPRSTGGAQVWSENCMRCHNFRQPRARSDREWETIVHHMRVRANLTGDEHRLILRFLKSAN